jgi:hypothetical protein
VFWNDDSGVRREVQVVKEKKERVVAICLQFLMMVYNDVSGTPSRIQLLCPQVDPTSPSGFIQLPTASQSYLRFILSEKNEHESKQYNCDHIL